MDTYLSDMLDAYLECELWSGLDYFTGNPDPDDGASDWQPCPLDEHHEPYDICADTRARHLEDVAGFLAAALETCRCGWEPTAGPDHPADHDFRCCLDDDDGDRLDPLQVGQDFSLTRNRHGAGFWDRGLGDRGDVLTALAHPYGGTNWGPEDFADTVDVGARRGVPWSETGPVWCLWHGGSGYAHPDPVTDVARFASLAAAVDEHDGAYRGHGFTGDDADYSGATPCVGLDCTTWVYLYDPTAEGGGGEPYPDFLIEHAADGDGKPYDLSDPLWIVSPA